MVAMGRQAVGFTLHSLRRGGTRYLQDKGATTEQITSHVGWKSTALLDYVRPPRSRSTYAVLKALS